MTGATARMQGRRRGTIRNLQVSSRATALLFGALSAKKRSKDLGEFRASSGPGALVRVERRSGQAVPGRPGEGDKARLATLLGLSPAQIEKSDEVTQSLPEIQAEAAKSIGVKQVDPDRVMLLLGDQLWPFPFPAVRKDGKWSFQTVDGLEEVINRRIGENELTTIANLRQIVDAQELYRATDWDQDGVNEYAQKLISSPGAYDGLFWQPGTASRQPNRPGLSEAELATGGKARLFRLPLSRADRARVLHVAGARAP